jgi:hypothetical protein
MSDCIAIRSQHDARWTLALLVLLALAGIAVGWRGGQLPRPPVDDAAESTAPDLALYATIIADVRGGSDYYAAARERIPQFGFPISSPLNWRLPTYAWTLSLLPNKCWIQLVLLILGMGGLVLTFHAERTTSSVGQSALTTFLMFGVVRWVLDGQAYLAQEVWAAMLITISIAALRLGENSLHWRLLAVFAGTVALLFRELALPYCLVATTVALWQRRWLDAALWMVGLAAFAFLLGYHVTQVQAQLAGTSQVGGAGLAQWLRFGGLDFVLLTGRMNGLLFAAPPALLWTYLLLSLFGLAQRPDRASRICCLAALGYVVAFAVVGRPENFYWGLLYAPLLPGGLARGLAACHALWQAATFSSLQASQSRTA